MRCFSFAQERKRRGFSPCKIHTTHTRSIHVIQDPTLKRARTFSRLIIIKVIYHVLNVSIYRSILTFIHIPHFPLFLFPITKLYNSPLAAPRPPSPLVSSPVTAVDVLRSSKSLVLTFGKADNNVCFAGT